MGISTHYRHEADNSLSVKIEGEVTGIPVFEQLAVVREGDLFDQWAPFCARSSTIKRLGRTDNISWFETTFPIVFLTRDCLFRGIACDNMHENRNIMIVSKGINDKKGERKLKKQDDNVESTFDCDEPMTLNSKYLSKVPPNIDLPPKPKGKAADRIELRCFQSLLEFESADTIRTRIIVNLDPNLAFIPQWMIEFCMKKIAGVLLLKIQRTAKHAFKNPHKSLHAKRIKDDTVFYKDWLVPRFEYYYRKFGWTVPNIPAFAVPLEDTVVHIENSPDGISPSDTISLISDHSRRSGVSVSSKISLKKWAKEREYRKKRKQIVAIALSRSKVEHMMKPKGLSDEKMARKEKLLNVVRASSDEANEVVRNDNHHNQYRSMKKREEGFVNIPSSTQSIPQFSILYPIITLFFMMVTIFGKFSFKEWSFLGVFETDNNFVIFLRTLFLLSFYGFLQIQVIWSSLIVVFDTLELSATSSPVLKSAKVFYSSKMRYSLFLLTFGIIIMSFGKAFIIGVGRHIQPSFEYHSLLNRGKDSHLMVVTNPMESSVSHFRYFWNLDMESDQFQLFSLFTLKELILYVGKLPFWMILYGMNIAYHTLGDENPESYWNDITIGTASSWMAYSTTYIVILSIMFSSFLVPQKNKGNSTTLSPSSSPSQKPSTSHPDLTALNPIPEDNYDAEETSMSESHSPKNNHKHTHSTSTTSQRRRRTFLEQIEKGKARFHRHRSRNRKKNRKKKNHSLKSKRVEDGEDGMELSISSIHLNPRRPRTNRESS